MRFALMVTGPAYGTQQASSALQFARALLAAGHELVSVFFYREGVYNANQLTSPASDEFDLVVLAVAEPGAWRCPAYLRGGGSASGRKRCE